jgi:hypothetical protein
VVAVDVDRTSDETPELASADLPPAFCLPLKGSPFGDNITPLTIQSNMVYLRSLSSHLDCPIYLPDVKLID